MLGRQGQGRLFLSSEQLGRILTDLAPLTCLDVGARGGPGADLRPLAWAVDLYGFEPDEEECERLNAASDPVDRDFMSTNFLPVALGKDVGIRQLRVTKHRGTSSILPPMVAVREKFRERDDYFDVEDVLDVETMPLDEAARKYALKDAVYIKLDVEGLELEILESAPELLSSAIVAIRVEVGFAPTRVGQPCYCEIEAFLRRHGFVPMDFVDLHWWRPLTRKRHPEQAEGPIPYSRGQLVHGDALFFRDPDTLSDRTTGQIRLLLKEAFLALAHEYVDHAYCIFRRPAVREYLKEQYGCTGMGGLRTASQYLASGHLKRRRHGAISVRTRRLARRVKEGLFALANVLNIGE